MYCDLMKLTKGKELPLATTNADGESVIVEQGTCEIGHFFKLTTAQDNGWLRINIYYETGESEELYKK